MTEYRHHPIAIIETIVDYFDAFDILNHPNFDQPIGNIGDSQFGYSVRTISMPTSIFASFRGRKLPCVRC